ncbi:MAG: RagB/SusD family nutrient uptake outer membrane protein [Bacteroidetes bacterium]|nr:RagB/SusD family nutrient uptake outer membrane protein [Bacteroidota bacterium]
MRTIKYLKYILFSALVLATSCSKDDLEEISPDRITMANFWVNETNAKTGIMEVYQNLTDNSWRFGENEMCPLYYRGDDVVLLPGASQWSYLAEMADFTYRNTSSILANFWWKKYRALNLANWVLDNIDNVPEANIDDDMQKYIKGEAYFLRGVLHMQLLQNFEKIVLKQSAANNDNLNQGLSERTAAWTLITEDFESASSLLPEKWDDSNLGRATKNSAYGFLGKALLFQKEYALAHDAFTKIKGADLVSDYESLFNATNENSVESIFEIQFSAIQAGGLSKSHSGSCTMATGDFGGWNMFNPTQKLMNSFKQEKTTDDKFDKRLYASIAFDDPDATFLGKSARSYFDDNIVPKPSFKKYIESEDAVSTGVSGANFFWMRYADVLLMDAEALAEQGNTTDALPLINKVRFRAGLSEFSKTDKATVINEIRNQRFLEFNGEGIRFYDLVRWGIAKQEILNSDKLGNKNFKEPEHNYFPVPNGEIINNPNIDE